MTPFTNALIHSMTHSPNNSFTNALIHSMTHSPNDSLTNALIHLMTHSPNGSIHQCPHSFNHPFTNAPIHSMTHSLNDSFSQCPHSQCAVQQTKKEEVTVACSMQHASTQAHMCEQVAAADLSFRALCLFGPGIKTIHLTLCFQM